jgi:hypothetical protein
MVVTLFFTQLQSLFAGADIDFHRLGGMLGSDIETSEWFGGIRNVTIFYFQHGSITKITEGGFTITYVEYDLIGDENRSKFIVEFNNNENTNNDTEPRYISIYKANEIGMFNPVYNAELNEKTQVNMDIKDFNFEKGKPYIIIVRDKSCKIIEINKIVISE